MKTIDIVLVTYNRLAFTKQTLKSILDRTKFPFRLIVVDNASTDGSGSFLLTEKAKGNIDELVRNCNSEFIVNLIRFDDLIEGWRQGINNQLNNGNTETAIALQVQYDQLRDVRDAHERGE